MSKSNFMYLCDGKACDRDCDKEYCRYTHDESHAKHKCRRERKFVMINGRMMEK